MAYEYLVKFIKPGFAGSSLKSRDRGAVTQLVCSLNAELFEFQVKARDAAKTGIWSDVTTIFEESCANLRKNKDGVYRPYHVKDVPAEMNEADKAQVRKFLYPPRHIRVDATLDLAVRNHLRSVVRPELYDCEG